ncbi:hypothetical protein RB594_007957 [Gaeumannomyces avenae]
MPVVPEETASDLAMDEFIDWDKAGSPALAGGLGLDMPQPQPHIGSDPDMDLLFSNVNGDDFSFWALEHFANSANSANALPADDLLASIGPQTMAPEGPDLPESPCFQCRLHGYSCKTIHEGKYKGYCTSCVALRVGCSQAFDMGQGAWPPNENFPLNPWPVAGDHPNAIFQPMTSISSSAPDMMAPPTTSLSSLSEALLAVPNPGTSASSSQPPTQPPTPGPGKVGARLSKEAVRILKNWYSTHSRHPYPSDDEKESLQRLTGLSKLQISNWLANYRRRSKYTQPRSTSPNVRSHSILGSIEIPRRRGTPSPLDIRGPTTYEDMNPLQRWQVSPPENEPASATDIARAISASSGVSSGLGSPFSAPYTDDGSGRSQGHPSSASSLGTSRSSGGSLASAFSFGSRNSLGSLGSLPRGRRRRRKRPAAATGPSGSKRIPLSQPLKTFQCTFCTETFRTKHDWGRHEKSLHLSLERWVCCPKGAKAFNQEAKQIQCVFCGDANPDEAHLDTHNFAPCQEKSRDERTFYRKDHLRQHLKLVHNAKFTPWSMTSWEETTAEIRSRCGFCGIIMDSWSIRVEHLAEHFKTGNTMADWKGDWGFEGPVLDMVQSAIPPYLIHEERLSPLPLMTSMGPAESPVNAYDLIKYELMYWVEGLHQDPTVEALQLEACRIIFGAEALSYKDLSSVPSWLSDLIMSRPDLRVQAMMGPIRGPSDSQMGRLTVNGKDNIFDDCPLERQLRDYVNSRMMLGLCATDSELQAEACMIVARMEESTSTPSEMIANLLIRLIQGSKAWLAPFRQRAHIPRSEDMADEDRRPLDGNSLDSTIHNYSRLERELAEYAQEQIALGIQLHDADLQQKARCIIYGSNDGWNQTAADSPEWLSGFKKRLGSAAAATNPPAACAMSEMLVGSPSPTRVGGTQQQLGLCHVMAPGGSSGVRKVGCVGRSRSGKLFLNDMNCYRRLERELSRWLGGLISPNNPNRHMPTDEEIKHQARWILYEDDDPWNNTAADNAEWLRRFKRDNGLLPDSPGPGLGDTKSWSIQQGGTGFAPPYAYPRAGRSITALTPPDTDGDGGGSDGGGKVQLTIHEGAKPFETEQRTVDKFLRTAATRYPPAAAVFCSRELESGLAEFARAGMRTSATGDLPPDEALRARAREILETDATAADDAVLLEKFKAMIRGEAGQVSPPPVAAAAAAAEGISDDSGLGAGLFPVGMDVDLDLTSFTNSQMDDMFPDMDFDDGGAALAGSPSGVLF